MYFDLVAFLRYNYRAFFKTKGQHYRLTPKRFIVLSIWLILFIPAQIINRFFFLIDELFFWNYHKQKILKPVFIIGNPRSGTTFLHRLLDKDNQNFTSFAVWELIFAPSITQRKLIWVLLRITRLIGYPLGIVTKIINRQLSHGDSVHKIRLDEAEEDEYILIHSWTSETLWPLYPIKDELFPYFFFDRDIPVKKQKQIMHFYENMLQRHIYAHGGSCTFLSKNPSHTAKIAALTQYFPDAQFINLARNPFQSLPSMMDYMAAGWKLLCDPLEEYPHQKEFFEVMKFYYLYPVEFFQNQKNMCYFLKYEDLVTNPYGIVIDLYRWLGIKLHQDFSIILKRECENARLFSSKHKYAVMEMGLTESQIFSEFDEVFSYYEFDSHHMELPDHMMLWKIHTWQKNWKQQRQARKIGRNEKRLVKKTSRNKEII